MAIPDYQEIMLPILEILAEGKSHRMKDVTQLVADRFGLTMEEREKRIPSGNQTTISNRVAWAKTHMKMAGLVENQDRGSVRISSEGLKVLSTKPQRIDVKFLCQFAPYLEFTKKKGGPTEGPEEPNDVASRVTPKEQIDAAYKSLRSALANDLLTEVKAASPAFFEDLVVRLLVAMGYGGSIADAGKRIGKSGDGGIDGIIKEDRLGLDVVCIQAKRWEGTVGRPVVQSFVGSMELYRARKGVLITTSTFSADAQNYVNHVESKKIVLIDGPTLAELMIDFDVGVTVSDTYLIKKLDNDFFSEVVD